MQSLRPRSDGHPADRMVPLPGTSRLPACSKALLTSTRGVDSHTCRLAALDAVIALDVEAVRLRRGKFHLKCNQRRFGPQVGYLGPDGSLSRR
ncbi:hypothetical protein FQZ97_485750 [compost metagenome]